MAAYHHMLVHFPLAMWTAALLIIALRAFSDGELARRADGVLVPLLGLAAVSGLAAYVSGLLVWDFVAISESPLGRNHMLMGTWTLAFWALIGITRWHLGETVWEGATRWVMLVQALLGAALLAVTGTLGGHLLGTSTALSQLLRLLGWEVYTTFYVPNSTLILLVAASVAMAGIGTWAYARLRQPAKTGQRVPLETAST
jgi:uncharacterized membrane protein